MVGEENARVLSVKQAVSPVCALSVSDEGRFALCTCSGLYIMRLLDQPFSTSTHRSAEVSFFDPGLQPLRFDIAVSKEKVFEKFSSEDSQRVGVDVTLKQTLWDTLSVDVRYVAARWSPVTIHEHGASTMLAVLTSDHRLCVFAESSVTQPQWLQVTDLSLKYNELKKGEWLEPAADDMDFTEVRDRVYSLSAVDISWSPSMACAQYESDSAGKQLMSLDEPVGSGFSLLAVAMKSGHVILWKVPSSMSTRGDIELACSTRVFDQAVSCVEWGPAVDGGVGLLAAGSARGEIVVLEVRLTSPLEVTQKLWLFSDTDQMSISCLHWQPVGEDFILLASKEVFLLVYELQRKGDNYTCTSSLTETGQHSLQATGFSSSPLAHPPTVYMTSADGYLQKVNIHYTNKRLSVVLEVTEVPLDPKLQWKIHGLSVSPTPVFVTIIASPTSRFDHLKLRDPGQVLSVPLTDPNSDLDPLIHRVLTSEGSFDAIRDIMEYLRQCLCQGKVFPESFTQLIEDQSKWPFLPVKQLQILRYFTITKLSLAKSQLIHSEKILASLQKDIDHLSNLIFTQHASHILKFLERETIKLKQDEQWSLKLLCDKVIGVSSSADPSPQRERVQRIMGMFALNKCMSEPCVICGEELKNTGCSVTKCGNGHNFGCCCISMLACQTAAYRKCIVCKALSVKRDRLKGFPWLCPSKLSLCTLCGGQLK